MADTSARIAELEAELAALKREMQDFTYVVSHDLRAPLRHIVSFAQLVQEDAGPQLSSEVQGFLGTITESAQNLTQMLDALLALSRVGTVPLQMVPLSLQAQVQEVVDELVAAHPARQMEWRIAHDLPIVRADPALLRGALHQVLGNAVKFTAGKTPAIIAVTGLNQEGHLVLEVQDNGVGFNASATSRLQQPFQRLHGPRAFEGLGMGLALARKSLERIGGAIAVSGVENAGCTVRMQMPF